MSTANDTERDQQVAELLQAARENFDDLELAEAKVQQALVLNPGDPQIWFARGELLERHQQLEKAVDYYGQAHVMQRDDKNYEQAYCSARELLERMQTRAMERPTAEEPQVELPRVEPPRVEPPRVELPKVMVASLPDNTGSGKPEARFVGELKTDLFEPPVVQAVFSDADTALIRDRPAATEEAATSPPDPAAADTAEIRVQPEASRRAAAAAALPMADTALIRGRPHLVPDPAAVAPPAAPAAPRHQGAGTEILWKGEEGIVATMEDAKTCVFDTESAEEPTDKELMLATVTDGSSSQRARSPGAYHQTPQRPRDAAEVVTEELLPVPGEVDQKLLKTLPERPPQGQEPDPEGQLQALRTLELATEELEFLEQQELSGEAPAPADAGGDTAPGQGLSIKTRALLKKIDHGDPGPVLDYCRGLGTRSPQVPPVELALVTVKASLSLAWQILDSVAGLGGEAGEQLERLRKKYRT